MSATPPDYYAVLGLADDADGEAIRTAYRALAKQHHPDLAEGEDAQSTEKFLEIQAAYDVLGDSDRRVQYDLDRRRQQVLEDARRMHREWADRQPHSASMPPGMRPPVQPVAPFTRSRRRSSGNAKIYVGAIVLVAMVLGLILWQQREKNLAAKRDQIMVVRVDREYRGDTSPTGPEVLLREKEQYARLQSSQAEAARIKAEAEKRVAALAPPPAPAVPPPPPSSPANQSSPDSGRVVDCAGEGRKFSVFIRSQVMTVAYNGGAPVNPTIHDQGNGLIIMSMVESTNRISLGFMKGDKDRTILLVLDAVGNVFRTIGMECSAAVF